MRVLSVDLGTSNTVAVLSGLGRAPRVVEVDGSATMPSAVFAAEDGTLVVGRDAERRARLEPARFEPNPKRRIDEGTLLLGESVVPVTDALAAVLRRVGDETSRQLGGGKPEEVRLTHPAQWGPVRRNVLQSAARQAGLGGNLVLVPEPVAAASHFASFPDRRLNPGQALAVYDLGAGTFDVAVVGSSPTGFSVLAEAGLPDLGGLDVDQALLDHVGRQVSGKDPERWQALLRPRTSGDRRTQRTLREDIRVAKEALSRHPQTDVPLPDPFGDVLVTRAELESLIRPSLLRSVELLAGTIRATGRTPDSLAGIYLVGGSSRIPLIAALIGESLRVVPTSLDQPETAVALGAHHGAPPPPRSSPIPVQRPSTGPSKSEQPTVVVPRPAPQPVQQQQIPQQQQQPVRRVAPQPVEQPRLQAPRPLPPLQLPPVGYPPPVRSAKKGVAIAVVVIVVAVVAAVTFVLLNRGADTPAASCDLKEVDSKGFTPCMAQVATPVVGSASCKRAPSTAVEAPLVLLVNCTAGTRVVSYGQFSSEADLAKQLDTLTPSETAVSGTWSGGGFTGKYFVQEDDSRPTLFATVEGRPVAIAVAVGAKDDPLDYFNEHVKPS